MTKKLCIEISIRDSEGPSSTKQSKSISPADHAISPKEVSSSQSIKDKLWTCSALKLAGLATVIVTIICIVLVAILYVADTPPEHLAMQPPTVPSLPGNVDPNNTLPGGHKIYSKVDWGGKPANSSRPLYVLPHPTPYVLISHTVTRKCLEPNECAAICRNIQDFTMGERFESADISFNFLVGGDGNVYEGRGWDLTNPRQGRPEIKRNNVDICIIGNFEVDEPTVGQLEAMKELLALGVRLEKLDPDYKLVAHNNTQATLSPGRNMYAHIKEWSHFFARF